MSDTEKALARTGDAAGTLPRKSRLLVTGGAGFIGSNFVHYWLETHPGDRVLVLDALTYAGNLANLEPVKGHPDLLFVQGTHSMLKAARKVWLEERTVKRHRFHHVSTDEVYGSLGPDDPAFDERTPYAPNSPYSASKAASDHLVRAYHHTYGLEVTTSNCSNNYGPFHFPEKLIPLMIVNLLHGRLLPIYGDGRNVRDWLHVSDHCRGIDLILQKGRPGEVYNIGGGVESENLQLVETLCAVADEAFGGSENLCSRFPNGPAARGGKTASLIQFVKDRPGHDRRYAIDCGKIERELGYRAQVTLAEGLRNTFDWYLQNEWWWRAVMDGSYQRWIETHYR